MDSNNDSETNGETLDDDDDDFSPVHQSFYFLRDIVIEKHLAVFSTRSGNIFLNNFWVLNALVYYCFQQSSTADQHGVMKSTNYFLPLNIPSEFW